MLEGVVSTEIRDHGGYTCILESWGANRPGSSDYSPKKLTTDFDCRCLYCVEGNTNAHMERNGSLSRHDLRHIAVRCYHHSKHDVSTDMILS